MGVVQGFHPTAGAEPSGGRCFDTDAAELFLRAQCWWLDRGLTRLSDPPAVDIVLAAHNTTHGSWLALIAAAAELLGPAPAQAIAALYTFHGRVAGFLERRPDPFLSSDVRAGVRRLLHTRLMALTVEAVAALAESPTPAAPAAP